VQAAAAAAIMTIAHDQVLVVQVEAEPAGLQVFQEPPILAAAVVVVQTLELMHRVAAWVVRESSFFDINTLLSQPIL
jgi:hypothetical protein